MPQNTLGGKVYVVSIVIFAAFCEVESLLDHNTENDVKTRLESSLDNTLSTRRWHELSLLKEDTKLCLKDGDCHNGGTCFGGEVPFCSCKNGTSGVHCEIVDDCGSLCGNGTDVTCEYDQMKEKAVCRCHNESKKFDENEEICRVPCQRYYDCVFGDCSTGTEGVKFCDCPIAISGDRCEIIDRCESKEVDCGDDPGVICTYTYGKKGLAYCKCLIQKQIFDYDKKVCRECDCGEYSYDCWFEGGNKTCRCFNKYTIYKQRGEKCEECECGIKGSTYCEFINDEKKCTCLPGYVQFDGYCKECDCGLNSANCQFINDEKKCTCMPGYVEFDGYCKAVCNATHPCSHGGVCDHTCKCKKGTSGDFCEIVGFCIFDSCGWQAKCAYDEKKEKGYCACDSNLTYDSYNKYCSECDCGPNGNCSFDYGDKTCSCNDNYQYSYTTRRCERCYCGENGECSFQRYGPKACDCFDGYSEKSGICEECYCGKNGRCYFEGDTKMCKCYSFYIEVSGVCKECDCGYYGRCEYTDSEKTCICDAKYAEKNGNCEACNCYLNANCTFSGHGTAVTKQCICPEGFEDIYGVCTDIDECRDPLTCPPSSTECRNTYGSYACQCRNGYRRRGEDRDPKIYGCEETNKCFSYSCPTNARCVNIPGSYQCICLNGYTPITTDPRYGCRITTNWKVAYIILLVVTGFVVILLIGIIISNRKNRRRQRQQSNSQTVLHPVQ